ncbi:MAG: DUF2334 domain-containing protein [bacterium]
MKKHRFFLLLLSIFFVSNLGLNSSVLMQPAYAGQLNQPIKTMPVRPVIPKLPVRPVIPKPPKNEKPNKVKILIRPGEEETINYNRKVRVNKEDKKDLSNKGYAELEYIDRREQLIKNEYILRNPVGQIDETRKRTPSLDAVTPQATIQAVTGEKVLILYDAPPGVVMSKFGMIYAIMLRNLVGHFDVDVDLLPIENYVAGNVESYKTIFYLGAYYDNPVPQAFRADVLTTQKTIVWFRYNIWQMAWDATTDFTNRFGFSFSGLRGLNAVPSETNPNPGFFDTVLYKDKSLIKYYEYDAANLVVKADPDVGVTQIVDPAKATAVVSVVNSATQEQIPYIIKSNNFWYVADMPFSYIGPRDRYLVICDILHDILGSTQGENHRAMIRLEDVGALVQLTTMQTVSDYLYSKQIPFSVAVFPVYSDPLGKYNGGVSQEVGLSSAIELLDSLTYATQRGGDILMHGYTHQYGTQLNALTGVSGDDFEFWNIVTNTPVAEDSVEWALGRIIAGLDEFQTNGITPFTFEVPHYQASPNCYAAIGNQFKSRYERSFYYTSSNPQLNLSANDPARDFIAGQFFPYTISKDYYGQFVLPENLGNIEYDISSMDPTSYITYGWQELYQNAEYALLVRDGYASFFFHPFWLEEDLGVPASQDLDSLVTGITSLGYTWVSGKGEIPLN